MSAAARPATMRRVRALLLAFEALWLLMLTLSLAVGAWLLVAIFAALSMLGYVLLHRER